jgi:hypothetical protein
VARVVAEDLARAALVDKDQAAAFLEDMEETGAVQVRRNSIRFLR